MGCLFGCFSKFRHKKRQLINVKAASSTDQKNEDDKAIQSIKLENEELFQNFSYPISIPNSKKEGSFELNLITHEELQEKFVRDDLIKRKEETDGNADQENPREKQLEPKSNYRYENFAESESSFEGFRLEEFETVGDSNGGNGKSLEMEESSESSLFSLSIDSRKQVRDVELGGEKEVISPLMKKETIGQQIQELDEMPQQDQNQKTFGAESDMKESVLKDQEKENVGVENVNPIEDKNFDSSTKNQKTVPDQEIGVDTSLSSWLDESDRTPSVGNSASKSRTRRTTSPEGRCILGEINLKEEKQDYQSVTNSLVEDDVLGTIGCYWNRTGKATKESERSGLYLA